MIPPRDAPGPLTAADCLAHCLAYLPQADYERAIALIDTLVDTLVEQHRTAAAQRLLHAPLTAAETRPREPERC